MKRYLDKDSSVGQLKCILVAACCRQKVKQLLLSLYLLSLPATTSVASSLVRYLIDRTSYLP